MIIVLCGFMGAGKSSLLKRLGTNYLDLDEALCAFSSAASITRLIENLGLEKFRELEAVVLKKLFADDPKPKLLALGGGTLDGPAYELLLAKQKTSEISLVWLDTPFDVCWSRISGDESRPLVKLGEAGLRELYEKRRIRYQKARLRLDETEQLSLKTMADLQLSLTKIDGRTP